MFLLFLIVSGTANLKAQVRIGGTDSPNKSALLDLNTGDEIEPAGNLGLSLPRVKLEDVRQKLKNDEEPLSGTIVYNTNVDFARGKGIYFWADSLWLRAGATFSLREGDTLAILQKPEVKILLNPTEGLGASFGLNNYLDLGSAFRMDWKVTANGDSQYDPILQYTGTKREEIFVPYDQTERSYSVTVQAIADGYNDSPVSESVTSGEGIFAASYDLLGESYYDIAQTDYKSLAPHYPYGILAYRTPYALDTEKTYTYEIVGKGDSPSYLWSVTAGTQYLSNVSEVHNSSGSSVGLRFVDLSENSTIKSDSTAKLTVTLTCMVEDGTYNKTFTKDIEIGDRDVCIPSIGLTDMEGYDYTVYRFGTSGCWMTQNLRSTKTMQNGIEVVVPENANQAAVNTAAYYYPGTFTQDNLPDSLGLLYSWAGANIGTPAGETQDAFPYTTSTRQGICPAGWVIPSSWDYIMLEKEIAYNPTYYSTQTTAYSNPDFDWADIASWQPLTDPNNPLAWGRQMKSTNGLTAPSGATTSPAGGTSNDDGTGFNVLMVGSGETGSITGYGASAYTWTSGSYSSTAGIARGWETARNGVYYRRGTPKFNAFSVRCKKL
jgi:uncharacterized protein (TIGR02145 family)